METMSPQQQINISQSRSSSISTEDTKMENKRRMKAMSYRRQSAPSLVISKALTRSRTMSRENCLSPVCPETCLLVQSFLTPGRMFISHAYAQLKTGLQTQERHLFLFTDILLISKAKSSTNFKLKAQARVCEMWTANCMDEVCEGSNSPEKSFVMGWPTCNCVATFSSVEQKEKWLSLMKSRIKDEKEKDHPKTIPLRVYTKDFSYKTLAVSNSDSANEVTRLALQQFGIVGCVKDYQLWVSSRKDNSPYPLIGHEYPFSIQMSHIREPLSQTGDVKSEATTPPDKDKEVELLFDQLQTDSQCQFILKPSRVAVGHSFAVDPDQKPFKRRRSLINWAFWRGSSTQLDDPPPSPFLPTTGRLFGLPLSVVCTDNSLPKPIMDMLVFLYQEGPFTRGIFRRSAGAKACRELRDILDSGFQDIQLARQSIFVIAAVFKDFLRSIPGSLLLSDLYEKWMATMDSSDEAEDNQLQAIQSLVTSLPSENILLLKHILAVLYNIQLRAEENQMNAFNLAVCISPSMLSSSAQSSPEMEGEGAKKVCDLARIMIENCTAVMGEDVTTLFDGFPQRCNIDGHGSDISSYQMTDSSYDSLENELNDDSGSPFQPMQRSRGKPDSRSCDSVLTLSDCDLDQPDQDNTLNAHHLLSPLAHPVKTSSAVSPSSPRPCSPCEVPALQQGIRQLRRCSEPAIWSSTSSLSKYLERVGNRKGSYDGAASQGKNDAEMLVKHLKNLRLDKQSSSSQSGQKERPVRKERKEHLKPPPLHLDASCSSLYSPAASPTRSSMSSLDSAFSQHSADFAKPCSQPVGTFKAIVTSSPRSPGFVSIPSPGPTGPSPKESPPKERFDWSQLRSTHGLHPNTWLKRDHRLSLSKDRIGLEHEETEDQPVQSDVSFQTDHIKENQSLESSNSTCRKRSTSPPSYQEAMLQTQNSKPVYYHASEKPLTVKELRELHNQACILRKTNLGRRYIQKSTFNTTGGENSSLPKSLFYGQSGRCLALYRQKSYSLIPVEETSHGYASCQRRASEPGSTFLGLDRESAKSLEYLHRQAIANQDRDSVSLHYGLKVSDVEPHDRATEPCLSPSATKAVKDYFTLHGGDDTQSNVKKSQEVALAVVHGKREWIRRCSDPRLEDFEKMFFAEESYV
ncbi:rho GTPase-activating protein 20-like [Astyanax mexicanus]|uniref:Rho GTPase-activating protein 20 n=1 Tax=Astyanax mexicanus TaxID=7994 RepID=A0A8T2KUJ4_ASTMX|nr:rho GTPase-activating protein 20-like [Astyanax mexicanus]